LNFNTIVILQSPQSVQKYAVTVLTWDKLNVTMEITTIMMGKHTNIYLKISIDVVVHVM